MTMVTNNSIVTSELAKFGELLDNMIMSLSIGGFAGRRREYSRSIGGICGGAICLDKIKGIYISDIKQDGQRRKAYVALSEFAEDVFASHSREIFNMYCDGRNIK